jgi:hypothetical protein
VGGGDRRWPTLDAVTSEEAGRGALGMLGGQADHRDAAQALLAAGWTPCGAGDWAIALRSPDGTAAARISPFDPTGPSGDRRLGCLLRVVVQ